MKNSRQAWVQWITIPGMIAATSVPGYATVYLNVEEAQQAIFPGDTFTQVPLTLTSEQRDLIKKKSGVSVRIKEQKVWRASSGGYLIVDEVLGKHEFITYAVGINADGSVKQIEIMDYRETFGYEIRNKDWRWQFVGKTSRSEFKLDSDIKNISGATLSCKHITDGVKRILATYEIAIK